MVPPQPYHLKASSDFHAWLERSRKNCYTGSADEVRSYVSRTAALEYLQNGDWLFSLLSELFPASDAPDFEKSILTAYPLFFCILLFIGRASYFDSFAAYRQYRDDALPLENRPSNFPRPPDDKTFWDEFWQAQWQFFPVVLERTEKVFDAQYILPFTTKDFLSSGESAKIYRVTIPREYDKISVDHGEGRDCAYALKTYVGPYADHYYKTEKANFKSLQNREDGPVRGLIGYHCAYQHGHTYNLLLELAHGGTLEKLLTERDPPHTGVGVEALWDSLSELLYGVHRIHELEVDPRSSEKDRFLQGVHQDIRPANILVTSVSEMELHPHLPLENVYHFKLCDLGLTRFVNAPPGARAAEVNDALGSQSYGAPEVHRKTEHDERSIYDITRKADVWSLGSVYLELAVWVVHGPRGVHWFRTQRAEENMASGGARHFHNGEKADPRLLECVKQQIGQLENESRRSDHVTGAVLKWLVGQMLRAKQGGRPDIGTLIENWQEYAKPKSARPLYNVGPTPTANSSSRAKVFPADEARSMSRSQSARQSKSSVHFVAEPQDVLTTAGGTIDGTSIPGGWMGDGQAARQSMYSPSPMISDRSYRQHTPTRSSPPSAFGSLPSTRERVYQDQEEPDSPPTPSHRSHAPPQSVVLDPGQFSNSMRTSGSIDVRSKQQRVAMGQAVQSHGSWRPQSQPVCPDSSPHDGIISDGFLGHPSTVSVPRHTSGFGGPGWSARQRGASSNSIPVPAVHTTQQYPAAASAGATVDSSTSNPQSAYGTPLEVTESPPAADRLDHAQPFGRLAHASPILSPPATPAKRRRKPAASNPPTQTVGGLIKWKAERKKWHGLRDISLPENNHMREALHKRDHVFLVDDSASMHAYRDRVIELFDPLAYLVKEGDPDGIDLRFAVSPKRKHSEKSSELTDAVKSHKFEGKTDISVPLRSILSGHCQELRARNPAAGSQSIRPISIYVLTDGVWAGGQDAKSPIRETVKVLQEFDLSRKQVGIQFISFGKNKDGLARLAELDDLEQLEDLGMDIVDTERYDGNVWKMLLGAFDKTFDEQDDEDDDPQ